MSPSSVFATLIAAIGGLLLPFDVLNAEDPKVPASQPISMEFVEISPGEFQMGSPEDEPDRRENETPHKVRLTKAFKIGKCEVTQAQFETVMGFNPSLFEDEEHSGLPVEQVSWFDAVMFCNRLSEKEGRVPIYQFRDLKRNGDSIRYANVKVVAGNGYRLPTDAEWEYSCRAGTTTAYLAGATIGAEQAEFGENLRHTENVDKYAPNPWGLHNMQGNVSEWCWDFEATVPSEVAIDPTGPFAGETRLFRGGNWYLGSPCFRSAFHMGLSPGWASRTIGFRVVLGEQDADPSASAFADADHELFELAPHISQNPPKFNAKTTREVATDRIQSTIQLLAKLDKTHADNPVVEMRLGDAYRMAYILDIEDACESSEIYLKKAIEHDPDSFYYQSHTLLGTLYCQSDAKRVNEAVGHFERAIEIAGDFAIDAYRGLVFAYIIQGNPRKALQAAEDCLKIDADIDDVQALRAALRASLKNESPDPDR